METADIVDYAKPCMDAEKALKDAHNAVLEGKFDEAMTKTMDAVVSVRLMYGALRMMKDKEQAFAQA
jgi:uncharacterized protein YbjQ (UPF0145 family)